MRPSHQRDLLDESPRERVEGAMRLLHRQVGYHDFGREVHADAAVRLGLDAVASALVDWQKLWVRGAAPLDQVLAALGADDDLVERTAELIELLGPAAYSQGPETDQMDRAEDLRRGVVDDLEDLLDKLEEQDREGADA